MKNYRKKLSDTKKGRSQVSYKRKKKQISRTRQRYEGGEIHSRFATFPKPSTVYRVKKDNGVLVVGAYQ